MILSHKLTSTLFDTNNQSLGSIDGGWAGDWGVVSLPADPTPWWQDAIGIPPGLRHTSSTETSPMAASQTVLYSPDDSQIGHSPKSAINTSTNSTSTTSGSSSTSGLVINITWDSSVQSAPAGFTTGVIAAVQWLESHISDPVNVNIDVGYGEENGYSLGSGTLGQNQSYLTSVSYSQLLGALSADATSTADAQALASLPSTSPVNGAYWVTTAQAKALGLLSATSAGTDAYVGFSSSLPFTYNDTSGVTSGTYDFTGTALHEISEVMGRELLTGRTVGTTANSFSLYDLFHYSAPGVRDFSASTPGYFSINGGSTVLAAFNTNSGGDAGDWASSVVQDAADAFATAGVVNGFSATDLTALDTIGWNLGSGSTTTSPTSPTSQPTGVSFAVVTHASANAQSQTSLAPGSALATAAQVGGAAGDSYTYALGGAGASVFSLASAGNVATLSAGGSGVAGTVNGQLYNLTVTASDTTAGTSSPAAPLDVIVGSGGSDTIQVAALVGSGATTVPTLIYPLAGADTINGSGMSGELSFVSGTGADTMTGGSGVNDYVYGATSDSTSAAMDVITNFHANMDLVDLTGLGTTLSYAGQIGTHGKQANTLAAHAIGWQSSSGSTYIYVNTTSSSESVGSANMEIRLNGAISLASGNFLHS